MSQDQLLGGGKTCLNDVNTYDFGMSYLSSCGLVNFSSRPKGGFVSIISKNGSSSILRKGTSSVSESLHALC